MIVWLSIFRHSVYACYCAVWRAGHDREIIIKGMHLTWLSVYQHHSKCTLSHMGLKMLSITSHLMTNFHDTDPIE